MIIKTTDKEVWNDLYENESVTQLPWYGIPFLSRVRNYLKGIGKTEPILVPGCGLGDTVNLISKQEYTNVVGTDISNVAISKARLRFPKLTFYNIPTEEISKKSRFRGAHVIDWLNLHQIDSNIIKNYLHSLDTLSSSLLLSYFYDSSRKEKEKSLVREGFIYNHTPRKVETFLPHLIKTSEIFYVTKVKHKSKKYLEFRTVIQTYRR